MLVDFKRVNLYRKKKHFHSSKSVHEGALKISPSVSNIFELN